LPPTKPWIRTPGLFLWLIKPEAHSSAKAGTASYAGHEQGSDEDAGGHKAVSWTFPLLDDVDHKQLQPNAYLLVPPDTLRPGGEHESVSPTHPLQDAQVSRNSKLPNSFTLWLSQFSRERFSGTAQACFK